MPEIMGYPFVPKSTAHLRPGHFWAVPLDGNRFACGQVLQVKASEISSKTRMFFGGLCNWIGRERPTADVIRGRGFVGFGVMHIKAVLMSGGEILGDSPLDQDVSIPLLLSHQYGNDVLLLRGAERIRLADKTERESLPVKGVWGYDFIRVLAEAQLAKQSMP